MYTTTRTNQGGSVAIFLVVSTVLAALVIGGVYIVQKRGADVRTSEPIAQQKNNPDPSQQKTENDQQKADDQAKNEAAQQKQQEEQKKREATRQSEAQKKAEAEKAAREKAEAEQQAGQQQAAVPNTAIPQTSTAPAASSLPTTGPEDTLLQVVAGAILTAIVIAYLKSYRHRFGSLRQ